MPVDENGRFQFPTTGWSEGRTRKRSDYPDLQRNDDGEYKASDQKVDEETIAQHKSDLISLAGQMVKGKVSPSDFMSALVERGWSVKAGWQKISTSQQFMRALTHGTITFLDPLKRQHDMPGLDTLFWPGLKPLPKSEPEPEAKEPPLEEDKWRA
jgi:hypothetical protein